MRDNNDLIAVNVISLRHLTLDLEQLEQQPMFRSIVESLSAQYAASAAAIRDLAIREYLEHYINTDQFPHQTPGTTGPGSITQTHVEVVPNGNSESNQAAA